MCAVPASGSPVFTIEQQSSLICIARQFVYLLPCIQYQFSHIIADCLHVQLVNLFHF